MAAEPTPPPQPLKRPAELNEHFQQLLSVVDRLRSEQGCPWDRQQTPQSLIPYLLEEAYEVIESIEANDQPALQEELGDLLLHILFQGRIAQESGQFTIDDSVQAITAKLIRRHPHVFGDQNDQTVSEIRQHWETAKQQEKGRDSVLDGVPRTLPALTRALRMQGKAASVGFDWPTIEPVWGKVHEELAELQAACDEAHAAHIEEEFGDLLFSLVNLGRFLRLSPEEALRKAIGKFERRFHAIEQELASRGLRPDQASLEEMDAIWNRLRRQPQVAEPNTPPASHSLPQADKGENV
ncbi:MAG: nucleoside triphosphate pyrophosphohydrolase [bacterium]|nr:nucleoside triphosphate pyrophosphohydrolase [bacterium]